MSPTPWPPVPAAGCLDGDDVAVLQFPARLRRELLAIEEVASYPAWLPAFGPAGGVAAAVCQEGEAGGLQDLHGADDAVAAAVLALAAGAIEELVAGHAHGVLELEGFDGGVQGVGHADVDAGGAWTAVGGALAAAYRASLRESSQISSYGPPRWQHFS